MPRSIKTKAVLDNLVSAKLDQSERLEVALALVAGVKNEIKEDLGAVMCVAEGQLDVVLMGLKCAKGFF